MPKVYKVIVTEGVIGKMIFEKYIKKSINTSFLKPLLLQGLRLRGAPALHQSSDSCVFVG